MRLALATCSNLPSWEVDARPLHAALAARGVEAPQVVWDDPGVDWTAFDAVLNRPLEHAQVVSARSRTARHSHHPDRVADARFVA